MFSKKHKKIITGLVLFTFVFHSTVGCSLSTSRPKYSRILNETDECGEDGEAGSGESLGEADFVVDDNSESNGPEILDSSVLDFYQDGEGGMHWSVAGESGAERGESEPGADAGVDAEIEKIKSGDSLGNLQVGTKASTQKQRELMREMSEAAGRRIRELRSQLRQNGIDPGYDADFPDENFGTADGNRRYPDGTAGSGGSNTSGSLPQVMAAEEKLLTEALEKLAMENTLAQEILTQKTAHLETLRQGVQQATAKRNEIWQQLEAVQNHSMQVTEQRLTEIKEQHNTTVKRLFAALPADLQKLQNLSQQSVKHPENALADSPIKSEIQTARLTLEWQSSQGLTSDAQATLNHASQLLNSASQYASQGDVARAQKRIASARRWQSLAEAQVGKPLAERADTDGLNRGAVAQSAQGVLETALELERDNKHLLADVLVEHAQVLMEAAVFAVRMVPVIDNILSTLEAVTGQTVDFDQTGSAFLRNTSDLERYVAIAHLGITATATLLGGPAGVLAAGTLMGISKAIGKREGKVLAKEAVEAAAKQGLGKFEQEAVKKSTLESAEKASERLGKEADKILYSAKKIGATSANDVRSFGKWIERFGGDANALVEAVKGPSRKIITLESQLQKKFKHAEVFGISGNMNKQTLEQFATAIEKHVAADSTKVIEGTYHQTQKVIHYLDPNTAINVMKEETGQFLSAWKLNAEQLKNVLERGSL